LTDKAFRENHEAPTIAPKAKDGTDREHCFHVE